MEADLSTSDCAKNSKFNSAMGDGITSQISIEEFGGDFEGRLQRGAKKFPLSLVREVLSWQLGYALAALD